MLIPKLIQRKVDPGVKQQLEQAGLDPVLADIVASRPLPEHRDGPLAVVAPKLAYLDNPFLMRDMDKAVARLAQAVCKQECIGIETDHDCDGQTSHAVLHTCLQDIFKHPVARIKSYIGHRMKEGYGLSDAVAERILADPERPSLLLTADNGSADEPRIARLRAAGIDVIVTDHHEVPVEGPPRSAFACLNPTRKDCDFPDPYIAGCMVAWLLMAATRRRMLESGQLPAGTLPMTEVLDFVAVGTVADCVSMARSVNNRVVVRYGMQIIRQAKRACWQAILPLLNKPKLSAEDLGFVIGPLLNSDGRLSDAFGSVNFLLADDLAAARPWVETLWQQNKQRKQIQQQLTAQAIRLAEAQVAQGRASLVIWLEDGHAGVHGISASRIKDLFGRPTILFSPKLDEHNLITGSARSIDKVNIRSAIQTVAEREPGLVAKFGGHKGAAGLAIDKRNLAAFMNAFEAAVLLQVDKTEVGPMLLTDGVLPDSHFNLDFVEQIQSLDPYGREFDLPTFEATVEVINVRRIGQTQCHAQLRLRIPSGAIVNAVWFNCAEHADQPLQVDAGQRVHIAFNLCENHFREQRSLQLQIGYLQVV